MRTFAVVAIAVLVGCGKSPDSGAPGDPPGYGAWKYRNFIIGQTFSGGATLDGSIDIDASRDAGPAAEWIEVALNGNIIGRTSGSTRISHAVRFRPGPNWIRFFSSRSRLGWEFDVDARQGTRFDFTPKDKIEWSMSQVKDE